MGCVRGEARAMHFACPTPPQNIRTVVGRLKSQLLNQPRLKRRRILLSADLARHSNTVNSLTSRTDSTGRSTPSPSSRRRNALSSALTDAASSSCTPRAEDKGEVEVGGGGRVGWRVRRVHEAARRSWRGGSAEGSAEGSARPSFLQARP
eukprot:6203037-Pleurochrysis_carterae.AAC.2